MNIIVTDKVKKYKNICGKSTQQISTKNIS